MYNDKQYTAKELGEILAIDSMKRNIKVLGQKRVLEIINGGGLVLTDNQRAIYRTMYFKTLHELEG